MAIYGIIGTGNMGGALARALCKAVSPEGVILFNRTPAKAEALAAELGCRVAESAAQAVAAAEYVLLGVKPQMMAGVLAGIAPSLRAETVLVTMAAGISMAAVEQMAGGAYPVIRIMPNTPVAVGAGMTLYTANARVDAQTLAGFLHDLAASGRFAELTEAQLDAGACVSGCGPAFADLFLEALADGAVACGLPRNKAMALAAQMLLGSAQLALDGTHPGVLKDRVCSPAGTTIQGVRALEKGGFRSAVMEAVIAAYERTMALKGEEHPAKN